MAIVVDGDPNAPFSLATTPRCRGGWYSLPWIAPLIMLSVKQGGIKYHFLSLWYDSIWDWTQVSEAISELSNHHTNVLSNKSFIKDIKIYFCYWNITQWKWILLGITYYQTIPPWSCKKVIIRLVDQNLNTLTVIPADGISSIQKGRTWV